MLCCTVLFVLCLSSVSVFSWIFPCLARVLSSVCLYPMYFSSLMLRLPLSYLLTPAFILSYLTPFFARVLCHCPLSLSRLAFSCPLSFSCFVLCLIVFCPLPFSCLALYLSLSSSLSCRCLLSVFVSCLVLFIMSLSSIFLGGVRRKRKLLAKINKHKTRSGSKKTRQCKTRQSQRHNTKQLKTRMCARRWFDLCRLNQPSPHVITARHLVERMTKMKKEAPPNIPEAKMPLEKPQGLNMRKWRFMILAFLFYNDICIPPAGCR